MAEAARLKVLGLSGSLRKASWNTMLLRQIQAMAPAHGIDIDIWPHLKDVPLFDGDDYAQGFPPVVQDFRQRLREADGLIIVSPEYNHSIAGTTKNLIDWASRAPDQPVAGKPIATTGASVGRLGGPFGQYALRLCFVFLDGRIMNQPEVFVGEAPAKFDAEGRLTDGSTAEFLDKWLAAFAVWIRTVGVKRKVDVSA